jgi:hypothetical protein
MVLGRQILDFAALQDIVTAIWESMPSTHFPRDFEISRQTLLVRYDLKMALQGSQTCRLI